uniref:Protein S100 n=3 Tax=Oreochromis aureus TaxID=47969 RepID=A0A668SKG5_OREAU
MSHGRIMSLIMSQLQQGMAILIATFHKYSGKEGDKLTLSKGELKELLEKELGDIFGKTTDKAALDKIFKDLDANADGTVDFQEYVTLVACLTMLCNEFFTKK